MHLRAWARKTQPVHLSYHGRSAADRRSVSERRLLGGCFPRLMIIRNGDSKKSQDRISSGHKTLDTKRADEKHILESFRGLLVSLSATGHREPRASAQDTVDSVLRPPKGSQVAIVVFEDLECPMCRRTAPLVKQAAKTYKIPVVRHDFPLGPMHPWSFQAAVMARYFDAHSKA